MSVYGIPYQGSKSSIAEEIIASLPSGNRLVDLFGGGFAISHCGLYSYKYKQVLYNDINPLLVPLIKDCIAGKYNYSHFKPEWISKEEFYNKKDSDGFIKLVWSFGNDGNTYIYGAETAEIKRQGHDFCVNGTPIPSFGYLNLESEIPDIKGRRLELIQSCQVELDENPENPDAEKLQTLMHCEHLERIERMQKLENLHRQDRLQFSCMDYREYKYQDGDVVYCDIPYQNNYAKKANDYGQQFDSGAFYAWAIQQPFPVYFSSYSLGGIVWESEKRLLMDSNGDPRYRREVLYCVDDNYKTPNTPIANTLF